MLLNLVKILLKVVSLMELTVFLDEDRNYYTSLTNVEPDTNFNFNTNQAICKNTMEKSLMI